MIVVEKVVVELAVLVTVVIRVATFVEVVVGVGAVTVTVLGVTVVVRRMVLPNMSALYRPEILSNSPISSGPAGGSPDNSSSVSECRAEITGRCQQSPCTPSGVARRT